MEVYIYPLQEGYASVVSDWTRIYFMMFYLIIMVSQVLLTDFITIAAVIYWQLELPFLYQIYYTADVLMF
jgi:hypothetical protein